MTTRAITSGNSLSAFRQQLKHTQQSFPDIIV